MTVVSTTRSIFNPIFKDKATFLQLSAETGHQYSMLEIEVAPGGGNSLHFHQRFEETFTVLRGELRLQLGEKFIFLQPGESATVPIGELHCFSNPSTTETVVFHVRLDPGSPGFERSVQIAYGLAADGLTDREGVPKKLYHLALVLTLSDTYAPGPLRWLRPLFVWMAGRAVKKGIDKQLIERYCRF